MADDRKIHRRAMKSAKVSALSDFDFRVWATYELIADDCGVMPATAAELQAGNDALEDRPAKALLKALANIVAAGLLLRYEHQGRAYVCQHDWQDYQKIRYPRESHYPFPPAETVAQFTSATAELFQLRLDKRAESAQSAHGAEAEGKSHPTRTGDRAEPLTTNQQPAAVVELERGAGKTKRIDYPEDFETAWRAYPLKTGKGDAYAAWKKAQPDLAVVLDALRWQVNQPKWAEERGKYIPHFSTWLNQSRWDDEPFHAPDPTDQAFAMVEDLFQRKASGQ